jgi:hypothetical protein
VIRLPVIAIADELPAHDPTGNAQAHRITAVIVALERSAQAALR